MTILAEKHYLGMPVGYFFTHDALLCAFYSVIIAVMIYQKYKENNERLSGWHFIYPLFK